MTLTLMCIGYRKKFVRKPQIGCRIHSESYQIILNNHETSSEMFWVVSNVRDKLREIFSNFFHRLHIWYHDISSNYMIFRLRLLLIEFKNRLGTRWRPCFLNKAFEISFGFMGMASICVEYHEYQFSTLFFHIFESLAVQIWLYSKNYRKLK
jgi:hypothetical protein